MVKIRRLEITIWWIRVVLWPYHLKTHGDRACVLLLDNCSAHKVDTARLPSNLNILFLPPNVTNTHQPADMGMIASLKVGYKTKMLSTLLDIFDAEGGYERAKVLRSRQRVGCKGLQFGGKATLLDAIEILKDIWDADAKYARSAGILRCWWKANILPIGWEVDIENAVGRATVSEKDKTLSDEDCEELCLLFERVHASAQSVSVEVTDGTNGLTGSFAEDPVPFERDDWRKMANVWAFVEDDPVVLDAEVDAELGIDGEGPGDAGSGGEDDEVEAAVVVTPDEGNVGGRRKPTIGVAELLDVEQCIEQLRVFNTTHKLPSDVAIHIDRYAYLLRRYQAAPKIFNPTLNAYFKSI